LENLIWKQLAYTFILEINSRSIKQDHNKNMMKSERKTQSFIDLDLLNREIKLNVNYL